MKFFGALLAFLLSPAAFAENSSAASSSTGLKNILENKKFEEDKRVTDMELKAQAGSLSRYSLKFSLAYTGAPLEKPFDDQQPNPDNSARDNRTNIGGSGSMRYRINPHTAVNAITGWRAYTPFQHMEDDELQDPGASIDYTYVLAGWQLRSALRASATTTQFFKDRGQMASSGLSQSVKLPLGDSRWTAGAELSLSFFHFNREYRPGSVARGGDGTVSNYYFALYPSLEYRLSDKFNVQSSLAFAHSNLRREGSWWLWDRRMVSQRLGVGYSPTRTIYFGPYVNFFPEKFVWETASLNFNTVFSIF